MTTYLVTIRTECAMYEETVEADTKLGACRAVVRQLIDDGEIDPDESIGYHAEEYDE